MKPYRWNNFVAILATANHIGRELHSKRIGNYQAICDLIDHGATYDGWSVTLVSRAVDEIERLRDFRAADADLIAALNDRIDEREAALADAGMAQCQGEDCGLWERDVLMHNGLCSECHATEVSIGNIFGKGDLEAEARAQLSARDCLRRGIR